jgi:PIN domain nuclease of toxin-antitoxin system
MAFPHLAVGGLTLCEKKRLTLRPNPQAWIANALHAIPMREAAVTYQVAEETARVSLPHRHPRGSISRGHSAGIRPDTGHR